MKHLKKIYLLLSFFVLSCASAQYLESYEPVNVFLETQKLDKKRQYILLRDKIPNTETLRLFNRGEGAEHIIDSADPMDYTNGLFKEEHWEKMYKDYAQDTIARYWKKKNFPKYNFVLENKKGFLGQDFMNRYLNSRTNTFIVLSEPIYYMDKKYIMFYFDMTPFGGSPRPQLVVMKKENEKWIIARIIGDYVYY